MTELGREIDQLITTEVQVDQPEGTDRIVKLNVEEN